ncbi:RTA1 like protein-domain-containing protein [Usnea florida]
MASCPALTDPHTTWSFCPKISLACLFTILFALSTIIHITQAIIYRKRYCWVIICSGVAQTLCYVFRVLSIQNPASISWYAAWFVLILVAPLLTNAFAYMVMGRMVYNFTTQAKIFGVKAWRFTLYFVFLDATAFFVQIAGAAMASGDNVPDKQVLTDLHIYQGGVALQQFFILVFAAASIKFHQTFSRESPAAKKAQALRLLYIIYAVLALITLRIVFRIVEYSKGLTSTIPNHEAYQYCLDSLPMLVALVLFNIVHPGRIMAGKESDFPSRKERKYMARRPNSADDVMVLPTREPIGITSEPSKGEKIKIKLLRRAL